jgi:hypothetical protein
MIADATTQSSFSDVGGYLAYGATENDNRVDNRWRRVNWETGRNVLGIGMEDAIGHMRVVAAKKGSRTEKPVYHVILSWQSGNEEEGIEPDDPSREEMEAAADRVRAELGLEEHQAWIVAHRDTGTKHLHMMINRVHPATGEVWEPDFDQRAMFRALRDLEEEYGWDRPAEKTLTKLRRERKAESLEIWEVNREKQDGPASTRKWARDEAMEDFREAWSWAELERRLEEKGASLEPRRERGMVLEKDGGYAALSSIHSEISRPKLEERFEQSWEAYRDGAPSPLEDTVADYQLGLRHDDYRPDTDRSETTGSGEGVAPDENGVVSWARGAGVPEILKAARSWKQAEEILIGMGAGLRPRPDGEVALVQGGHYISLHRVDPEVAADQLATRYGHRFRHHVFHHWRNDDSNGSDADASNSDDPPHRGPNSNQPRFRSSSRRRVRRVGQEKQEAAGLWSSPNADEDAPPVAAAERQVRRLAALRAVASRLREQTVRTSRTAEAVLDEQQADAQRALIGALRDVAARSDALDDLPTCEDIQALQEALDERQRDVLREGASRAQSLSDSAEWILETELSDHQHQALRYADLEGRLKQVAEGSQEKVGSSPERRAADDSAGNDSALRSRSYGKRAARLRQILTAMSSTEVSELKVHLDTCEDLARHPGMAEAARAHRKAIEGMWDRVRDRPEGERLTSRQVQALSGLYNASRSASPDEPAAQGLREAVAKMDEGERDGLKAHLEGEPEKRQHLTEVERQVRARRKRVKRHRRALRRQKQRREAAREHAYESAGTKIDWAIRRIRKQIDSDNTVEAGHTYIESQKKVERLQKRLQATLRRYAPLPIGSPLRQTLSKNPFQKGIRSKASLRGESVAENQSLQVERISSEELPPESKANANTPSLAEAMNKALTEQEWAALQEGIFWAEIRADRMERGDQEAFTALRKRQRDAVQHCEALDRRSASDKSRDHRDAAARLLARMDDRRRQEVVSVLGSRGRVAYATRVEPEVERLKRRVDTGDHGEADRDAPADSDRSRGEEQRGSSRGWERGPSR